MKKCTHNYKIRTDENGYAIYAECLICGHRIYPKLITQKH